MSNSRQRVYQIHRIFNHERFTYTGTRRLKSQATKDAKRWRKQGSNVRIIKVNLYGKSYYNLYRRK